MNNLYTIRVGHPLLRPGLTIETEASERYLVAVTRVLMDAVREINDGKSEAQLLQEAPRGK